MKAMKLKRCLHMRFQERGLGVVSTWFLIHTFQSQWIGSPQFSLRSGWSSHTMDSSCAVSGHGALGRHHILCHHPGIACSLLPACYTSWQRQTILLGSWNGAPGLDLGKVGGCVLSSTRFCLPFATFGLLGPLPWLPLFGPSSHA